MRGSAGAPLVPHRVRDQLVGVRRRGRPGVAQGSGGARRPRRIRGLFVATVAVHSGWRCSGRGCRTTSGPDAPRRGAPRDKDAVPEPQVKRLSATTGDIVRVCRVSERRHQDRWRLVAAPLQYPIPPAGEGDVGRREMAAAICAATLIGNIDVAASAEGTATAAATQLAPFTLEVTREVTVVDHGWVVLEARLSRPIDPMVDGSLRDIQFEIVEGPTDADGNSPRFPDLTCTIAAGYDRCTVSFLRDLGEEGWDQVMAWIDRDLDPSTVEADADEGRYAGSSDCLTDDVPCNNGIEQPGKSAEPDVTDVVEAGVANRPPVARDDFADTTINRSVTVAVLDNDSDVDGDPLSVDSYEQPASGSVEAAANGQLTYTPRRGFHGTDTFIYVTSDGRGGTARATVQVTVRLPNSL